VTVIVIVVNLCCRFRSNEEGCRDAVVIGNVPVSESQSYFEIGRPLPSSMNTYYSVCNCPSVYVWGCTCLCVCN